PWFINAEGIYYRTDLVPNPPTSPTQLVTDAKQATAKDPSLKEGLAFEGDKYEGVVTAFINFLGGYGGKLDPSNLATSANQQALQFMHDVIYKDRIAPQAVTGWEEPDVERAYLSGQAAFAMNWPYVFAVASPRPVNPDYPKISEQLQTALSSVLANQSSPGEALQQAQSQIASQTG